MENVKQELIIEASELLECFQWDNNFDKEEVCDELADVVNYCILLANKLNVDLETIILKKLNKTKIKYPVNKSKD